MERTAILVLGHGSPRARANEEFEALVAAFRRRRPDLDVAHAYIELAAPLMAEGLARLAARAERVVVLPLFLLAAGHVKQDLPGALHDARCAFPRVRFQAARPLGVHRAMVEIAVDRARLALAAGEPRTPPPQPSPLRGEGSREGAATVLIAVGRGTSDPDANGDFCKLVRLVGEAGGFTVAEPSFIDVAGPRFEAAAARVALAAPERVLVLPYFLFEGVLVERLAGEVRSFAARHPGIDVRLAPHLGEDDRLLALLDARLAEALGGVSLPCDACPRSAAA